MELWRPRGRSSRRSTYHLNARREYRVKRWASSVCVGLGGEGGVVIVDARQPESHESLRPRRHTRVGSTHGSEVETTERQRARSAPGSSWRRPGKGIQAEVVPLLQGQGARGRLQERRAAAPLHLRPREDPVASDERSVPPAPATACGRDQASARDGLAPVCGGRRRAALAVTIRRAPLTGSTRRSPCAYPCTAGADQIRFVESPTVRLVLRSRWRRHSDSKDGGGSCGARLAARLRNPCGRVAHGPVGSTPAPHG